MRQSTYSTQYTEYMSRALCNYKTIKLLHKLLDYRTAEYALLFTITFYPSLHGDWKERIIISLPALRDSFSEVFHVSPGCFAYHQDHILHSVPPSHCYLSISIRDKECKGFFNGSRTTPHCNKIYLSNSGPIKYLSNDRNEPDHFCCSFPPQHIGPCRSVLCLMCDAQLTSSSLF